MKNKTTQRLGNTNLSSFPKHDSLKYWRLNVNSHISLNTICKSIRDLSGGKWCFQRKYTCRQHETLDCRKLHKQLSNSCHRSGTIQYNTVHVHVQYNTVQYNTMQFI
jgi:hypothetical protein